MSLVAMLVVGALAGIISCMLLGGTGFGFIGDLLVGLAGSFMGGFFFGNLLHITASTFANVLIMAAVGAIIFLIAFGLFACGLNC